MSNAENKQSKLSRRAFVSGAASSVVGIAGLSSVADAQDMPMLDEADPTAVALKYVADATKADPELRAGERFCNNCALYAGAADSAAAPCSIFPGKQVAGSGWCSVWAPKAGS